MEPLWIAESLSLTSQGNRKWELVGPELVLVGFGRRPLVRTTEARVLEIPRSETQLSMGQFHAVARVLLTHGAFSIFPANVVMDHSV